LQAAILSGLAIVQQRQQPKIDLPPLRRQWASTPTPPVKPTPSAASGADPGQQWGTLYRLACIYSLSAAAVEESRAPSPLTPADKALQAEYRDKALTALEQSYKSGNRDFAYARVDADFIPIRDDPRFQRILALEKKGK
jgi:hypothetical protein